jgi:hypothetical protein
MAHWLAGMARGGFVIEIPVTAPFRVALAMALVVAVAPAAGAQGRYRLAIGVVGKTDPLVAEFRVCVPAETSDCGSWLVPTPSVDDPPVITAPTATRQLLSPSGADSLSIDGDAVTIRSLVPRSIPSRNSIREKDFMPRAIAVAPDSRYAFVLFEGARGGSSVIDMIELKSMAVIDTLVIRERPTGIALLR